MPSEPARRAVSLTVLFPAFCWMVAALALFSWGHLRQPVQAAGVFVLLGVVSWLGGQLVRRTGPAAGVLLIAGSVVMLLSVYSALGLVASWLLPEDREWFLMQADREWLGYTWEGAWSWLAGPLLSDVLQLVYTSFYGFPLILGFGLARRGDWEGIYNGIDRIILGFLLSYCGYLLLPTRSPYAFVEYMAELPSWGIQPALHDHLVNQSWTKRDCFPSGHTMMSMYVALLAWQRARPWFWVLGPWCALTIVATLYLRYHYVVDVLAGILACLLYARCADWIWGPYRPGAELRSGPAGLPGAARG